MYFYHFWCPKMKPWSALMAHLGLLLTFVTLGCSGVMCPDKCVCDDQSLKHDCSDGDLEGIPIFFNPETKVLKVRFYLTNNNYEVIRYKDFNGFFQFEAVI